MIAAEQPADRSAWPHNGPPPDARAGMPCDGTISISADSDFSLQNLPYGVFTPIASSSTAISASTATISPSSAALGNAFFAAAASDKSQHGARRRIGVALGNRVVDLLALHGLGVFAGAPLVQSSECFLQVRMFFVVFKLASQRQCHRQPPGNGHVAQLLFAILGLLAMGAGYDCVDSQCCYTCWLSLAKMEIPYLRVRAGGSTAIR